ncbi:MAG: hypothetical protein WCX71_03515 [Candidatus Buchananbacteria bacterium]
MIDLTNQEIFEEIQKQAHDALVENDVRRSNIFIRNMASFLKAPENKNLANFPQMQKTYQQLINQLSFVCLASLTEKEIINLLEENLLTGLENEYIDLIEKSTTKLVSYSAFSERDVLRRKMREALLRNSETLGRVNIKDEEKMVRPTVANWLKKYSAAVGSQPVGPAQSNQFLSAEPDVKKLSEKDLIILRKLVNFFEFLKESSQTPQGLEDPVAFAFGDEVRILNKGNFETVKLPALAQKVIDELFPGQKPKVTATAVPESQAKLEAEIAAAYRGDLKTQKAVASESEKISQLIKGDLLKLQAEFYKAVQEQNPNRTVAALHLLSQGNGLLDFIKNDQKLNKFLAATWEKKYGSELVADFIKDPTKPKYVRMFLQYVLSERLKLTENDAGRIAMQIGNVFTAQGKSEYNRLAYFDVASKMFKWFTD